MQWENVYIFISSTFNDMHAERDYLVKNVFPRLSAWCEERKLRLVDIDLRWGVSEADATENKRVVQVCLDRIDDCRPFFLCFLGQRRGWVPGREDISESTYERFEKLRGNDYAGTASVTEMEILHALVDPLHNGKLTGPDGAVRELGADSHSFFYLRDADYLRNLPAPLRGIYTNEGERDPAVADEALRRWREEIITGTQRPVHRYRARWDAAAHTPEIAWPLAVPTSAPRGSAGWQAAFEKWRDMWASAGVEVDGYGAITKAEDIEKAAQHNTLLTAGRLSGFATEDEPLSELILRQLQQAITERYGQRETPPETPLQVEQDQQSRFLQVASQGFIRRAGDFDALAAYLAGPESRPLALTARAGMGKTSLLARFIEEYEPAPGETLHYRFIGASDGSVSVPLLLRSLLEELQEAGKLAEDIPADIGEMVNKLPTLLGQAGAKGKTILVLDGLNQLETGFENLAWISASLPAGVKWIVSYKRGDESAENYHAKQKGAMAQAEVLPFENDADRSGLVEGYLSQYFKELDDSRMDTVIHSAGAANPLYLKTLLGELRVFGSHQNIDAYIEETFGDTPVTAFKAVLARLEEDPAIEGPPNDTLVPRLFGWLAHARYGLRDDEIGMLLRQDGVAETDAAQRAVQGILRQLRPYLARREGRSDFFFESFEIAAAERYTKEHPAAKPTAQWHAELAALFAALPQDDPHRLLELAWQYARASMGQELSALLLNYGYLEARLNTHGIGALLEDFSLAGGFAPGALPGEKAVAAVGGALTLASGVLGSAPALLPGQLWGRLGAGDAPEVGALLEAALQTKKQQGEPWLRPVLPTLTRPGGPTTNMYEKSGVVKRCLFDTEENLLYLPDKLSGTLQLLDPRTGKIIRSYPGVLSHMRGETPDMVLLADGATVTFLALGDVVFYNLHTGEKQVEKATTPSAALSGLALVGMGDTVAVATGKGDVFVCRKGVAGFIARLQAAEKTIPLLLLRERGEEVIIPTPEGPPAAYSADGGAFLRRYGEEEYLSKMMLSHDGGILYVLSRSALQAFDAAGGNMLWSKSVFGVSGMVILSPDGRWMASGSLGGVDLYDLEQQASVNHLKAGHVSAMAFSPDNKMIAAANFDKQIRVFDLADMKELCVFEGHTVAPTAIHFTSDGSHLISDAGDNTIRVWALDRMQAPDEGGQERANPYAHAVCLCPLPGGGQAACISADEEVLTFDVADGALARRLAQGEGKIGAFCRVMDVSADGSKLLLSMGPRDSLVLDAQSGNKLAALQPEPLEAYAVRNQIDNARFMAGDTQLVYRDGDCLVVKDWADGRTQRVIHTAAEGFLLCGGRRQALTYCQRIDETHGSTLLVWDLATGACVQGFGGLAEKMNSALLLDDGQTLLAKSWDGRLFLFDLAIGACLGGLSKSDFPAELHEIFLNRPCCVSGSRRYIAFASQNKELLLADLREKRSIATFVGEAPGSALYCVPGQASFAYLEPGGIHFLRLENPPADYFGETVYAPGEIGFREMQPERAERPRPTATVPPPVQVEKPASPAPSPPQSAPPAGPPEEEKKKKGFLGKLFGR